MKWLLFHLYKIDYGDFEITGDLFQLGKLSHKFRRDIVTHLLGQHGAWHRQLCPFMQPGYYGSLEKLWRDKVFYKYHNQCKDFQ